mmetsp:Transcript_13323/g.33787  ORF Transcript_13323/g.33787 Transcript_13323/m.33787 type:complete len:88 (+) Transcript_13323:366-629(+)
MKKKMLSLLKCLIENKLFSKNWAFNEASFLRKSEKQHDCVLIYTGRTVAWSHPKHLSGSSPTQQNINRTVRFLEAPTTKSPQEWAAA